MHLPVQLLLKEKLLIVLFLWQKLRRSLSQLFMSLMVKPSKKFSVLASVG